MLGARDFGYSIGPYLWLDQKARAAVRVEPARQTVERDAFVSAAVSPSQYLDYFALLSDEPGRLPLFDARGKALSIDRLHFTRPGACFVARRMLESGRYDWLLRPDGSERPLRPGCL